LETHSPIKNIGLSKSRDNHLKKFDDFLRTPTKSTAREVSASLAVQDIQKLLVVAYHFPKHGTVGGVYGFIRR